jgi:hypothetical protein
MAIGDLISYQFTRLWNTEDEVINIKLKVQLVWPDGSTSSSSGTPKAESGKRSLIREDSTNDNIPASPNAAESELRDLRRKYDAVVDNAAHLTAERDSIASQLDDLRRELAGVRLSNTRVGAY